MYAIVEIAGQQFKVSKDQKVFVHRLQNQEGEKVAFNNVLLLDNNGTITVGAPAIDGASVEAKVVKHLKGDKVIVFKKKRRKGYKVKNGHRQYLTEILIENIIASGAAVKPAKTEKKEEKPSKSVKADDLKKIEGIGPKASEALVAAGVDTFAKLAKKSAEEIKTILAEASSTLAHLDPQTWAAQAQLAADGKWDELKKWQDELNGGIVK
ncbi:50S ribosomal protein L21 [Capnocytophaga cynodegmi]|uniref:Large ribosomal subunit protein bL21 n=1 Tax=Capnocytophaga cynodegmi TaxID=28189 RepID=A0A0B7HEE7_9FLAO|nr:50S ribosomal protein L21 [Capnocytophaga cynodegmi]CEN35958.1 50S ribosomal protein L21 [Capnocytophaga cynodegmi]CEN36539.1 50S ribosomal protein L21 [Capnocytophaga cynodegmi]